MAAVPLSFDAPPGRVPFGLTEFYTPVGCAAGSVDTPLASFSLGANRLYAKGDSINFEFHGTFAGPVGSTSELYMEMNGLTRSVFTTGLIKPLGPSHWFLRGLLMRDGSDGLIGYADLAAGTSSVTLGVSSNPDFAAAISLVLGGVGLDLNEVVMQSGVVNFRGCRV